MAALDPRKRFDGAGEVYARHRPSYPDTLVERVLAECSVRAGDPAADVGCGTGILTRLLAARGLDVIGIDPNQDMLAQAREGGGPARYQSGEAEATGLSAASVAVVTVAQAFHWFDVERALAEFHRILRPGGHVAALWNLRAPSAFTHDYDALLRRFCSEYAELERREQYLDLLRTQRRVVSPRELEASNAQLFDFEGFRGRAWSSSYVIHGVTDREGFDAALRGLFDAQAHDGRVEFPYRSFALVFQVAELPTRR
jgi:ubiquinone/menaquinone biosynthesis C-methylase UbiE